MIVLFLSQSIAYINTRFDMCVDRFIDFFWPFCRSIVCEIYLFFSFDEDILQHETNPHW